MALSAVRFLRLPVYLSNTYWPGLMFIRTYLLMIRRSRVNKQFAEKLIEEVLPIACKENIISCDGGGGALGHPKVYINLVSQYQPSSCIISVCMDISSN
ncbi:NADH dehydrogenase (ubiquinone) Fe-S protein 6 [Schistosoma bovis]|uniref:NADH dehydrogenase (Ubiquinone) Fe-S protein 6 n=1 Tax=Schistosoma bovis TaxID=6184 RepID=A0A430QGM9_SCHBO|nr:NADH dehydrogenase (ubiquinone) Fe-S protein 6 [Schistosoma bovis]